MGRCCYFLCYGLLVLFRKWPPNNYSMIGIFRQWIGVDIQENILKFRSQTVSASIQRSVTCIGHIISKFPYPRLRNTNMPCK